MMRLYHLANLLMIIAFAVFMPLLYIHEHMHHCNGIANHVNIATELRANGSSKRVIVAGLARSGSTWQFNAVRFILAQLAQNQSNYSYSNTTNGTLELVHSAHGHIPRDFLNLWRTLDHKFSVIKVHQFAGELLERADFVISSHRDPRDVGQSCACMYMSLCLSFLMLCACVSFKNLCFVKRFLIAVLICTLCM